MAATLLAAVRVFVTDVATARDFYALLLGFRIKADRSQQGFCVIDAGGIDLIIESVPTDAPADEHAMVGRFTGLSLRVDDLEAEHRRLLAAGVTFSGAPEPQAWGGTLATLRDPSGNELQLVQYPQVSQRQVPSMAPITGANPTVEAMEARVARFDRLHPTADYADAGIPGSERTTWRVIGTPPDAPLAAEHFHLNLVRCAPGKSAPLHNHLTQEVFMPLSGTWEVFWGPEGTRCVRLGAWDTVNIPPGVSRGFRNVGDSDATLMGIAGGLDPGHINWPDSVRAAARAAGITLPDK